MKKKKAKARKQKIKKEVVGYPKQLQLDKYFESRIWFTDEPKFVKKLNKASDKYIKQAQKNLKKNIDDRNKKFGNRGDMGQVFHSTSLIGDPKFKQLQDYIGGTCYNLLGEMGFSLINYQMFTTEMWVQEFAQKGGGNHTLHTHWNGHISGFNIFFDSSIYLSDALFKLSTNLGSSANHIGHLKYSSNCNCLG